MAKDKSNNLGEVFLENIWGKREIGAPIPKIDVLGPIRHQDVLYLLSRYPFLQLVNINAAFPEEIHPKFVNSESGWVIHDYGDALSASPGELLFGDYSQTLATAKAKTKKIKKEEDEGGGETGVEIVIDKGTVVNLAVITASDMIALAMEKGWAGAEIIAGTALMQWAAWMAAEDFGFKLEGYVASRLDKEKRERILKQRAIEEAPRPRKGLGGR
jgi:hypothetical protein